MNFIFPLDAFSWKRCSQRLTASLLTSHEIPPSTRSHAPPRQPSLILFSLSFMRFLVLVAFLTTMSPAEPKSTRLPAGLMVWCNPEALRLIRTADEVYIFPVTVAYKPIPAGRGASVTPHADYKHRRPLGLEAVRELRRLLGKEGNWFHGHYTILSVDRPRRNVGFIFRKGKDKLVLLYVGTQFDGTFNGENTGGMLEEKPANRIEDWKKLYSKPELAIK